MELIYLLLHHDFMNFTILIVKRWSFSMVNAHVHPCPMSWWRKITSPRTVLLRPKPPECPGQLPFSSWRHNCDPPRKLGSIPMTWRFLGGGSWWFWKNPGEKSSSYIFRSNGWSPPNGLVSFFYVSYPPMVLVCHEKRNMSMNVDDVFFLGIQVPPLLQLESLERPGLCLLLSVLCSMFFPTFFEPL